MEKYTVDRIEDGFAVCENEECKTQNIPLTDLPPGLREGDVILLNQGKYEISKEETQKLRKEIFDLQNSLFN